MKRILMLGLVLALLATMILSTAAFAGGPCGTCDGDQAHNGTYARNGQGYGPGDGTGGAGGGMYGPGDGVCDN